MIDAYPRNQKPPIWSIDPGIIAYNCQKHGFPHPVLAMPMWGGAGNRALDYSGHGNHGTLTNGPGWVADGIELEGVNDKIDAGNDNSLNPTTEITVSCWIYPHSNIQNAGLVSKWTTAVETNNAYILYLGQGHDRNKFSWYIQESDGSAVIELESVTTFNANEWIHVVGIADGTNLRLYINSIEDSNSPAYDGTIKSITKNVVFGSLREEDDIYPYDGIMENVQIFNTALTAAQVKFLYDNPYFMYQIPEELYGYVSAVGGIAPTSTLYGPLYGPMAGPIGI